MLVLPPNNIPSIEESAIDSGSYVFHDAAILGTRLQINLVARNFSDAQAAAQSARGEIDRLNAILNSRSPESELHALNRARVFRASPELFAVIEAAERWRTKSGGAFSGRLGRATGMWRDARERTPSRAELARVALAADKARIGLDGFSRTIERPDEVEFALDALAKGWIVDRAYEIARSSPGVSGALVDIGGDVRCGGRAPGSKGWCIGVPDPTLAVENAPLAATTYLSNHAIATSGRGPRDREIGGTLYSPTLSPRDGWPVNDALSVSALASSAADADAIATALLTMPRKQGVAWAERHGIAARIQTAEDVVWTRAAQSAASPVHFVPVKSSTNKVAAKKATDAVGAWPRDWLALITFTAPPRQLVRDQYFRSPYMAMWMTDLDNKPVRTLLLVGNRNDWQKDNYIWWALNNDTNERLVATRSMSTSGSGIYKVFWDGTDDQGKPVKGGTYVMHIETSRERGKHTHRELTLDFSQAKKFYEELPSTEEAGGVQISFYHP